MSITYDMENLLVRANKLDCEMQMLILKTYYEVVCTLPVQYKFLSDDSDVFDLCVDLWEYICDIDHNHASITECSYLDFLEDVVVRPLEEIHYLSESIASGDKRAERLWERIQDLRKLL